MIIFQDPKNPLEVKDYTFDWSKDLGDDTITNATSEWVNGADAGMVKVEDSNEGVFSSIWVSGGTSGQKGIVRATINTQGGRTFTQVGLITVVEDVDPNNATVAQLREDLAALKSARISVLTGSQIKEVWREGRRIVYNVASVSDLEKAISQYEGLIADATVTETGAPRRFRALRPRF